MINLCEEIYRFHEKSKFFLTVLPKKIAQALEEKKQGKLNVANNDAIQILVEYFNNADRQVVEEEKNRLAKELSARDQIISNKEIQLQEFRSGTIFQEQEEAINKLIEEVKTVRAEMVRIKEIGVNAHLQEVNVSLQRENNDLKQKVNNLTEDKASSLLKSTRSEEENSRLRIENTTIKTDFFRLTEENKALKLELE